jgi:hypothetical protein
MDQNTMNEKLSIPDEARSHPAWLRLEDQESWYDKKSAVNQKWYKRFKLAQIVLAAAIPIMALLPMANTKFIVAVFGALIAILEGVQQLYQFHTLWTEYRSMAEHLKLEKYLFLSAGGPYRGLNQEDALILLAERIEEHISKEHAKWIDTSKNSVPNLSQSKKPA